VYTAAGRQLLEREPSAAYLHEWTHVLAQEQEEGRAAAALSALIFRLDTAWLALPTQVCKEVAEMRAIHTLPHRSGGILLGLVNIRGEIHLCLSLSRLLGLEQSQERGETKRQQASPRLLVVQRARDCWSFLVDEIQGVHHFHPRVLQPVPDAVATTPVFAQGTIAWRNISVGYLDPELVFAALYREIV
jgi:chemotaxis-related protein WspD